MDDQRIVMTIHDNRREFDQADASEAGFGFTSMRERATLIGGRLTIESRFRDGRRVTVEVPLPEDVPRSDDRPAPAGAAR